jgi:hypothetical protein
MIILAGGDSFIWGSELYGASDLEYSRETFPALIAKKSNLEYQCVARPGNANDAIARMTMNACDQALSDQKEIMVVVMWTFPFRYEFNFSYPISSPISPWASINPKNTKLEIEKFTNDFFKHVGSNDIYQTYNTLRSVFLLQSYLKNKNIPYVFTLADNQICNTFDDPSIKVLSTMIDWQDWYFFPEGKGANQTETPRGFYQWAIENKYSMGPGSHPLEQAHTDAALLIKEKFDEMVSKYL